MAKKESTLVTPDFAVILAAIGDVEVDVKSLLSLAPKVKYQVLERRWEGRGFEGKEGEVDF